MRKLHWTTIFVFTSLAACAILYIACAIMMFVMFTRVMCLIISYITFLFAGVWLIQKLSE